MSFKSKLYTIALLAISLAVVIGFFLNANEHNENSLIIYTEHVERILQDVDNLQAVLREYGLDSTPAYTQSWLSLQQQLNRNLENSPHVSDNMQYHLSSAIALNHAALILFNRLTAINQQAAKPGADTDLIPNARRVLNNRLYSTLSLISDESLNLSFGTLLEFKRKSNSINRALSSTVLIFSLVNVLIALLFAYTFSRRINELLARVKSIASGNLDTRASVSGNDEFTNLALQFNRMTAKLQESMIARTELEQMINQATVTLESQKQRLHQMAHSDSLTAIGNRALFSSSLEHAFKRAERSGEKLVVLYIDINKFKLFNDTHGHDFGDEVLKLVARRFKAVIRASDTIARLGGDEFSIIMEDVGSREDAETLSLKLQHALAEPQVIYSLTVHVKVSIGIAMYPDDARSIEELIRKADGDMYRVKRAARIYAKQ